MLHSKGGLETSIFHTNGSVTPGPNLPQSTDHHCLTKVNETHMFMAGGYSSGYSKKAYMINWSTKAWTRLPDMSMTRMMSSCARTPEYILVIGEAL